MALIGIDLGTTNSLVSAFVDDRAILVPNGFGDYMTPSAVSFMADGSPVVGKIARERRATHPDRTATEFKRLMGTGATLTLAGAAYTPEELSAFVLCQLVQDAETYLGEQVDEVVLSVPAYFGVAQRAATKRAARMAGLRVERLVNEPSAAALAHRRTGHDDAFLVFDFGGGTLDISVVDCFDNVISISAVSGDMHLGGADFDAVIAEEVCRINNRSFDPTSPAMQTLLLECEAAKRSLVDDKSAAFVFGRSAGFERPLRLTNKVLFDLSRSLFARLEAPIRYALADSDIDTDDISHVLMVGGASRMPVVRQYLRSMLSAPVFLSDECDTSVVLGLGAYVGIRQRVEGVRDLVLTDICPHSLSTAVANHTQPELSRASCLIRRNSVLPASRSGLYGALDPQAGSMRIRVFEGEGIYTKDNTELATFEVPLPSGKDGGEFRLTFTYDLNAMLGVEVAMLSTGKVFRYGYAGTGWEEGDAVSTPLEKIQVGLRLDGRELEASYLRARTCRLAAECALGQRELLADVLDGFERVMQGNNLRLQRDAQRRLGALLDDIEQARLNGQQGFFRPHGEGASSGGLRPDAGIPGEEETGDAL